MLKLLINNIFVEFGGNLSRQIISIPMGINCAPLLDDLFLYSYEAESIQKRIKDKKNIFFFKITTEAKAFDITSCILMIFC